MMYGAIVKETYIEAAYGRHDSDHTVTYEKLIEFETEEKLREWVLENDSSTYNKKQYRVIQFEELKVERTVSFNFK